MKKAFCFSLTISLLLLFSCSSREGLEIGDKAPDLNYQNPEGEYISLQSLKGKMVLIDFWASWCRPCRIENPNLVSVYHRYKDSRFINGEGFTIYSVSLDREMESWEKGIEDDELIWNYHVSDLNEWKSEAAVKYGINQIPSNYLIDGDGIIVAKNLIGQNLNLVLQQMLSE